MKHLAVLNKYFIKYKWYPIIGIVLIGLTNIFRVLLPQTIRDALDFVFSTIQEYRLISDSELGSVFRSSLQYNLLVFALLVVGYALLLGIFLYFTRQTIIVMSRKIEYDMRNEIFEHYTKMDLSFFKENKTGDLMSRISEDVSKVRMYLGPAIMYFTNLTFLFIIVIISMFSVNVELTLWTLIPLPVLSVSIYIVSNLINKKSLVIQKQLAVITTQAQEAFSGIRVIKAYSKEQQFVEEFSKESELYKSKSLEMSKVNALFYPLMILLISASTLITLYVGGIQLSQGLISPGNIAEFIIYVGMLTWPITSLGWIASLVQQAAASQERINEFMKQEATITSSTNASAFTEGDIVFENVSFTYPESNIEALQNVSFRLPQGKKLAILGKTASGKSSIAELIVRMYDPTSGKIKIANQELQTINKNELRHHIGYVPQDVFLFSETISNNIAFGTPSKIEQQEIEAYAEASSIKEDILRLTEGFETMVGERGVTLSGGQKQRISLARALAKKPQIIILDDCLSAVDAKTEHAIVEHFTQSLNNKTTIVITHRVHLSMGYDYFLILDKGRVAEFGDYDQLMKNRGPFFDIMQNQTREQ